MRPILGISVLLGLAWSVVPRDGVKLAWRFAKGDVLRYRVIQSGKQSILGSGGEASSGASLGLVLRFDVLAADGATATLKARYEAARIELRKPGSKPVAFDSTKPAEEQSFDDPYTKMLAGVLGQDFSFQVDARGRVSAVVGGGEIIERMVASLGNHPNKTSARAALVDSFGDDAIARTLSTLFAVVPDGAVKIGDRWESKLEWPLENLGKARFDRTFTLSGFENVKGEGLAKAAASSTPELQVNPEAPLAKQFAIEMKSSTGAGDLVFSMTKNRVRRVAMRQVMVVHCTPKLSESAPVKVDAVDQRLEMATTVEWLAEGEGL